MTKITAGPVELRIDTTDMAGSFNTVMEAMGYDADFGTNVKLNVATSIIQKSATTIGSDVKYIDSCGKNTLASLRGVFYLCCETGCDVTVGGKTYNLVDATYDKGAHFVIGTTRKVYVNEMKAFWDAFLGAVNDGKNIQECIEAGKDEAEEH